MPDIWWLIVAQRHLSESMSDRPAKLPAKYEWLCKVLAETFPEAPAVVVRDVLHGHGQKSDLHTLLVEVVHAETHLQQATRPQERLRVRASKPDFCAPSVGEPTRITSHIVKMSKDRRLLRAELEGWHNCRPVGMTHDSILMQLRPGSLHSIIYDDASHVIGAPAIMTLEEAVLNCSRWGAPSCASLKRTIGLIFERLGEGFYVHSYQLRKPIENLTELRKSQPLEQYLEAWRDTLEPDSNPRAERLRARRELLGLLAAERASFIDPVDYLRSVIRCPESCPLLLWGHAHGDLHGRNILVGSTEGNATIPAVFDYERMGSGKVIGWDFVKLETELKARALPLLFSGPEHNYVRVIHSFERHLVECTQALHDERTLPGIPDHLSKAVRLRQLLLAIRQQARSHLGVLRRRRRYWLEEYYFLLAYYGIYAARFDTYRRRNQLAALNSAGVAARLLSKPCRQFDNQIEEAELSANECLEKQGFDPTKFSAGSDRGEMSHHARLAFARVWCRSGKQTFCDAAGRLLETLRREYPHVLEIEEELILHYLERGATASYEKLLRSVESRYQQLSEEMLCRLGRRFKNRGVDAEPSRPPTKEFEESLAWYQRAYELRSNYYPGINVAMLQFVLGRTPAARKTAQEVLDRLPAVAPIAETCWIEATRAEAHLLLGQCEEAERFYSRASVDLPDRDCVSTKRQARLIVAHASRRVREYLTEEKINRIFPCDKDMTRDQNASRGGGTVDR